MKKKLIYVLAMLLMLSTILCGCGGGKESVLIYTSVEDYVVEDMNARLSEQFPDYDITVEYVSTGNHAAKLLAEGTNTECDITYDLEYGYMEQLANAGVLADLSAYDKSIYMDDTVVSDNYLIQCRVGGAIILNTELLAQKGLAEPTCYEDLLKSEYAGMISMANPKSSGTGYMFLKSLVNAWGEEKAFAYFDALTPNVLQYTSSGSGPVNALLQSEAAIGFGMTSHAVTQINEGAPLKVIFFSEGSPFTLYGQGMIAGKETRQCVKEIFDFLVNTYSYELNEKFFPEQMFKDVVYSVENYPQNIVYSDMSGNTIEEKTRLLEMWKY
ncbi:MAG: extracellular solute-binding protein [Oscillospiraceae bacterium]|nr:extracellular solute-binding protein [Oscillospiraceae bacterium]